MLRAVGWPILFLSAAIAILAWEPSRKNKSDEPDAFDIEPPILKQNLSPESSPPPGSPEQEVARLEKLLEQAKKEAAGAERLWKIGVLAKMEVEQRQLKVTQREAELANARVTQATEQVARLESGVVSGQNTASDLDAAKNALAKLMAAAQVAAAKRERAELDFAEANLRRQQKLLKLGSAHKSDVERAEEKLAELKAQNK